MNNPKASLPIATKRKRRTKAELLHLLQSSINCLGEYNERITIRHLFYRLANDFGAIDKTEKAYNNLRSLLTKWRRSGQISMSSFIDGTRWHYGFEGYSNATEGMILLARQQYRLNLWQGTDRYVEIWVEKDAVASIITPIASDWNLKTFVTRGDASISSLHDAAETFKRASETGRKPTIIYLGDYDEVGLDIPRVIQRNLLQDHDAEVELIRAGVTREQIDLWSLPTRPPKGGMRGNAIDKAVELDVLRPDQLRQLVVSHIEGMIDTEMIERMRVIEQAEREAFNDIIWQPENREKLNSAWEGENLP